MNSPNDKFRRRLDRLKRLHQIGVDLLSQIQGKKIMDARRRRTTQLVSLGLVLTLVVLGLDLLGVLAGMENFFYDQRCYYFQYNVPQPSPQIIHLDIDDSALQSTQRWPWPRSLQGRFIRELSLAKPKVIFLDIVYTESEEEKKKAEDEALASAIADAGNVLAPVTLSLKVSERASDVERSLETELMQPGKLTEREDTLLARLGGQAYLDRTNQTKSVFLSRYLVAREQAARSVIRPLLQAKPDATFEEVAASLGLKLNFESAPLIVTREQYLKLQREFALSRFCRPIPGAYLDVVAQPRSVDPPIIPVARAAATSGFVDFIPSYAGDSRVRYVPLWTKVNNMALPHVSLVMACQYLGVDIKSLEFRPDRLIIPDPINKRNVVIPTRTLERENHQDAAFVADIPWFGGHEWESMYDIPRHKVSAQHYSLTVVTNVFTTERNIDINVADMKRLIDIVVSPIDPDIVKSLVLPTEVNADNIADFRQNTIDGAIKPLLDSKEQELRALPFKSASQTVMLENIVGLRKKLDGYYALLDDLVALRNRQRDELKTKLSGKIVLIGFTATGMIDQYPTPLHNTAPGVVAHGVLVNGILTNFFWGRSPDFYTYSLTILLGIITTFVVAIADPSRSTIFAIFAVVSYIFFNGYVLFDRNRLVLGVAGPLTVIVVTWAVVTLARFILEIIERNRITARFSKYVDPELVNYVVENPEEDSFAGREKEMTVIFTDLQGFTTIAEKLGPGAVAVLNDYVAKMIPLFRSQNGFLDKFLGDGIMVLFNAVRPNPRHALDAVTAVFKMQAAMGPINERLRARNLPELHMRVGVNSGSMIVGDAGGLEASNFTVLGDNVNLAARLESANKPFGSWVLITQSTLDLVGKDTLAVRPIARVRVKGKEQAVMVYEPICFKKDLTPDQAKLIELTENVFNAFVAADFARCITACDAMTAALGETKFAKLYREESEALLKRGVGSNFDGVVELHEK
jgi:class 3 adenylate cyclase/CHASE2 domain-containing sensor protein